MAASELQLRVKVAWWLTWVYLPLTALTAVLTRRKPDQAKVEYWVRRAITFKQVK